MNPGPFPETYNHGRKRIDNIYISEQRVTDNYVLLFSMVEYNTVFLSNHRPLFIDLDADHFFDTTTKAPNARIIILLQSNDT